MKVKLTLGLAALACALALPSAVSAGVSGTTITVNTTADNTGGPGCTLRDAITAANTDAVTGGCTAGRGADTIDFSVSGQINLLTTLPAVAGRLAIEGSDQNITVSGQGAVRVLEVSAGASLTLDGISIADGDAANAGGILNNGTTVVRNSSLSGNFAEDFGNGGGIWNTVGGKLTVRNCTFSANGASESTPSPPSGGGIYNDGKALVVNSTFADNGADHGGGIFNGAGGTLKVKASTFSANSAGEGGGITNRGALRVRTSVFSDNSATLGIGGAISNRDGGALSVASSTFSENFAPGGGGIGNEGTLRVARSTFSGNGADGGGGIANFSGTLLVENSTFFGNSALSGGGIDNALGIIRDSTFFGNTADAGAAIRSGDALTVTNTIVAGSTAGGNCSGPFAATSTSNLADDATCGPGFTLVGLADLRLGPLADNGGPTQTIALGSGSVAIDAGDNAAAAGLFTDQRGEGFPRIVNGTVDVGSFEVQQGT
jgi:CSLREA domain-containing protein